MAKQIETITDVHSKHAQQLFRGFAAKIREVLMADAAKQFTKVSRSVRKMKDGETRQFQTRPLMVSVRKKFVSRHKFNLRITVSRQRTQ